MQKIVSKTIRTGQVTSSVAQQQVSAAVQWLWLSALSVVFLTGLLISSAASANPNKPVVLELFTSQGCSSCPPADALLTELSKRENVIALSFHVDYWDYIGWKDEHAIPVSTDRQQAYRRRMNLRYVYTPQVVINGREQAVGSRLNEINHCIAEVEDSLVVAFERGERSVAVTLPEGYARPDVPLDVHLVTFKRWSESKISRGENHGRRLGYTNSVKSFEQIGQFAGDPISFSLPNVQAEHGAVLLVQGPNHGPMYGVHVIE